MKMGNHVCVLFLFIFLRVPPRGQSWPFTDWFSSKPPSDHNPLGHEDSKHLVAEYKIDPLDDPKAARLIENARRKIEGMNPCWSRAYQELFSSCSQITAVDEKRYRLAWHLSNCFQQDTGRDPFPYCSEKDAMVDCLSKLNNDDRNTILEFYLEANSICHQLQSAVFKSQIERLVNDLKIVAENAEDKLETINEKSDDLLQNSNQIHQSITSIDARTQHIGQTLKNMLDYISTVLKHSKELNEQAKGIATAQVELLDGQGRLREKLDENMATIQQSYETLDQDIQSLQNKAIDVLKEVNQVGEAMSSQMQNLQGKADDIATMAGTSIDKQQELLQKQSLALEGLQSLTSFLSKALQESRISLQHLVDFAHGQHQELLHQQEQLKLAHDHLANNSRSILAAQEAFESKQASMFAAIDKLFALHNAMLLESRLIKAFLVYSMLILVIYMLTSTKQTYAARCKLYLGLCIAFAIECTVLRFTTSQVDQQTQLRIFVKPLFGLYAVIQILYSILTYRDYEAMNHKILVSLMDKVNGMNKEECFWEDDDVDSEVDWPAWVVAELPEEVDINEDPDYMLPATAEQVRENLIVTSAERNYNLRRRR